MVPRQRGRAVRAPAQPVPDIGEPGVVGEAVTEGDAAVCRLALFDGNDGDVVERYEVEQDILHLGGKFLGPADGLDAEVVGFTFGQSFSDVEGGDIRCRLPDPVLPGQVVGGAQPDGEAGFFLAVVLPLHPDGRTAGPFDLDAGRGRQRFADGGNLGGTSRDDSRQD